MISQYKDYLNRQLGKRDTLQTQLTLAEASVLSLTQRAKDILDAQVIIQQVAVNTQAGLVFRIENIVNKVLQSVFPEYSFTLVYEVKRGKSEASLKFFKGLNEVDIMDSVGGGITDMASIGLRLAVWSLSGATNVLVLDEILKHLSRDNMGRASDVIKEVCASLELQLIFVTHSEELKDRADRLFTVSLNKKGVSQVV